MCELLQCVNSTAQYVNSNNCLLPKAKRLKKKKTKKAKYMNKQRRHVVQTAPTSPKTSFYLFYLTTLKSHLSSYFLLVRITFY